MNWYISIMGHKKPKNNASHLNDLAYNHIRSIIVSGSVPLGASLNERLLSQKLHVSRTPIKNAFSRLHQEGMVRIIPRKGVYPVSPNLVEYQNLLDIREFLEGLAARLAVDYISNVKLKELKSFFADFGDITNNEKVSHEDYAEANAKFHREVLNLSNNQQLIIMVKSLYDHLSLGRLKTIELTGRIQNSMDEHRKIIKAFERRDADEAEKTMRLHIRSLKRDIKKTINNNDGFELIKRGNLKDG